MIEEPYRWVEAIANRREYIEMQLSSGRPLAALSYREGILFLTLGRSRQKVFEIYDRIAMGAIGHPGDIERLRMAAIELASTEGFTRSAADVSLRRLAHYSLSPVMKNAFEQVYGAPFLARLVFAEIGATPAEDLFLRVEYDGSIATSGNAVAQPQQNFAVLSATRAATKLMEKFLSGEALAEMDLADAVRVAADAWSVGHMAVIADSTKELPARDAIAQHRQEQLATVGIEAAVLERNIGTAIRYRALSDAEARGFILEPVPA
jgi:proteasome alpha subunit